MAFLVQVYLTLSVPGHSVLSPGPRDRGRQRGGFLKSAPLLVFECSPSSLRQLRAITRERRVSFRESAHHRKKIF
jgi:hypothetical protein